MLEAPVAVCAAGFGVSLEFREVFGIAVGTGFALWAEAEEGGCPRADGRSSGLEYNSAHSPAPATKVRSTDTNGDLVFRFPGADWYRV